MVWFFFGCAVLVDPDAVTPNNTLAGELVVSGLEDPGNAYILLYDANDPPPPSGTGRPVNFAAVPASRFTGEGVGLQAAPWEMAGVPDGTYLVTTLVDQDFNFHPLIGTNSGATCGDVVGAHLADATSGTIATVTVSGGVLLDNVTVVAASVIPVQRPVFTTTTTSVSRASDETQLVALSSSAVAVAYAEGVSIQLDGPFDGQDPCDTAFFVEVMDADGDGAPDPHPNEAYAAQGLLDIWPRIYLSHLSPPEGESYAAELPIYPDFVLSGQVPVNTPVLLTSLNLVYVPAALHTTGVGTDQELEETVTGADVPAGLWSISVISATGQTWTVPNEAAAGVSLSPDFDPASQGVALVVE